MIMTGCIAIRPTRGQEIVTLHSKIVGIDIQTWHLIGRIVTSQREAMLQNAWTGNGQTRCAYDHSHFSRLMMNSMFDIQSYMYKWPEASFTNTD